jgi:hypothetical protein
VMRPAAYSLPAKSGRRIPRSAELELSGIDW